MNTVQRHMQWEVVLLMSRCVLTWLLLDYGHWEIPGNENTRSLPSLVEMKLFAREKRT